jgi:hypothetical protein
VLASDAVDRGFVAGVMVSVLASGAVDRGFIVDVMVNYNARLECCRSSVHRLGNG